MAGRPYETEEDRIRAPLEEKAVSLAIREVADGTLTLEKAEAELEAAEEALEEPVEEDGNEEI